MNNREINKANNNKVKPNREVEEREKPEIDTRQKKILHKIRVKHVSMIAESD